MDKKLVITIITAALIATTASAAFDPASLSWQEVQKESLWQARDSHAAVSYKGKIWLMGGVDANGQVISTNPGKVDYGKAKYFSDVWSSADGVNWELATSKAPWGQRRSVEAVEFKGKIWLMGGWGPRVGYKNDIWSSTDGKSWKKETSKAAWPAREGHQLVVFQDKMYLIGGVKYGEHRIFAWFFGGFKFGKNQLFNDVWCSSDGVKWQQITKNSPWPARWDFASTEFAGRLWVISGMDYNGNIFRDVWSSIDGKNWELATNNPLFSSRQGGVAVNYQNNLWILGRLNSDEYGKGANDVWYSADGENWKKTKADPLWAGREDFSAVVFNDRIWILGGMDKDFRWVNDVWKTTSNLD